METILNDIEARVLGCLIEKELATPEYYPLTLNALTNACNQKSNRDPVMTLEEDDVGHAYPQDDKLSHILAEKMRLSPAELAVLAELLLRGPQTVGELRTRADRMHPFADLSDVEEVLEELMARTPPLVARLPRQPGRKEQRHAHLFSGEPVLAADERVPPPAGMGLKVLAGQERIEKLEEEVAALREEVACLQRLVEEFKAQFE